MADSTHSLKIQATLDTSQMGSTSASQGVPTGGSVVGAAANIAAARSTIGAMAKFGIELRSIVAVTKSSFEAFSFSLGELNKRVQVISNMYRKVHKEVDQDARVFRKLKDRIVYLEGKVNAATKRFQVELDKLAVSAEKVVAAQEAEAAAMGRGGPGGAGADAVTRNANALNRHTHAVEMNGNSMKRMMGAIGSVLALNQLGSGLQRIDAARGGDTGFGTAGKVVSAVGTIGMYAGAGAGLGTVVPGFGNAVGAIAGSLVGLTQVGLEHLADYMERINKEMEQLSRESEEYARAQDELRKATKTALEQIRKDALKKTLLNASPEMLEETLQAMEENVQDMASDMESLNAQLVLGQIKITEYTASMIKLREEEARAVEIRDKLQARYDAMMDQQMSEMAKQVSNFDYLSEILYRQIQLGKEDASTRVMKEGTWDDVLQALAEQNQENLLEQSKSKGYLEQMRKANFEKDWPAFQEARREYEESRRNLDFGLKMRGGLASALQEIFKEFQSYKGLNSRDFGQLAALGGFGSTSVLSDPLLDVNREQTRLLGEMLKAIRDQDTAAKYL